MSRTIEEAAPTTTHARTLRAAVLVAGCVFGASVWTGCTAPLLEQGERFSDPEPGSVASPRDASADVDRTAATADAGQEDATAAAPTPMPFGITSCQPAFASACKPPVIFENADPNGRGKVFTDVVPDVESAEQEIACTACSILYRDPSEIPSNKHPKTITIKLDTHGGVAQAGNGTIQFDLNYIAQFKGMAASVVKTEMLGVLQHETVHLYQNYGATGTGEGLADLVRARTGYYESSRWRREGTWKDPYTASGNFYSWLTGPCTLHTASYAKHDLDFPYELNKALAGTSGDGAFDATAALIEKTFGKTVDDLWSEYQATAF